MHCAKVTARQPHTRTSVTRSGISQSGPRSSVMKRSGRSRSPRSKGFSMMNSVPAPRATCSRI
eukprot:4079445-Prymnesium_polylepis.1